MGNSISNDSIWGKLSEMDQKLDKISNKQVTEEIPQIAQTTPSISKEDIKSIVNEHVRLLAISNDSHFEANRKNMMLLNNNILKTRKLVEDIKIPENNITLEAIQSIFSKEKTVKFGFSRICKTTFIIGALIVFLFMMVTFSMKQHGDYAILQSRFSWQSSAIRQLQIENDSLKTRNTIIDKKKKTK